MQLDQDCLKEKATRDDKPIVETVVGDDQAEQANDFEKREQALEFSVNLEDLQMFEDIKSNFNCQFRKEIQFIEKTAM